MGAPSSFFCPIGLVAALLLVDGAAAFAPAARAALPPPPLTPFRSARSVAPLLIEAEKPNPLASLFGGEKKVEAAEGGAEEEDDGKMTLDKVASFGIAGVLSIAVAETVFWVLSFPTSELLYFVSTGEWIDLLTQEGQLKFLAFTAGWGALGGAIAQYRTVLTAAAMTPWMDECARTHSAERAAHTRTITAAACERARGCLARE